MMKLAVVLPKLEQIEEYKAFVHTLFRDHSVEVATDADELMACLPEAEVLVSVVFLPITRAMLERAPRLRLIQVAGAGVDHVDLDAARELGITVASLPAVQAISVAEHVVMAMLALLRGLIHVHTALKQGQWPFSYWMGYADDLYGKTVGIIGMGNTGRAVATRLQPFGVTKLYYDVVRLTPEQEAQFGVTYMELDELLPKCDFVTLHFALTPETRSILNRKRLFTMKRGAFLINTARAGLIEEHALIEALRGHLGGAAIDVYWEEPLPANHPLLQLPNVILTPHGAGITRGAQQRIAQALVENLQRFVEGKPLEGLIVQGTR
ncbi:MAG: 2-hydroxyacid dehydrogenase [Armatimonadota bacterium]|nr:2-hydroxyacid dehydrogenase [Armatimonadota bacterium]